MDTTRRAFLFECVGDYVGLWSLVKYVRHEHPNWDNGTVMRETLSLLQKLLEDDLLVAGGPDDRIQRFVPWQLDVAGIVERIAKEWQYLNGDPDIGDIVWFIATPKGESIARSIID